MAFCWLNSLAWASPWAFGNGHRATYQAEHSSLSSRESSPDMVRWLLVYLRAVSFLLHFLMCMSTILRTASPGEYLYPLASTLMTAPIRTCFLRNLSVKCRMLWLTRKDGLCRIKWSWMVKRPKICGSPSKNSCPIPAPINIGPTELERVSEFKLLGVYVQNDLKWNTHVSSIVSKACKRIHYLRVCRTAHLPRDIGLTTYITKIRPVLEYASPVWGGLPIYLEEDLQRVQNRCLNQT